MILQLVSFATMAFALLASWHFGPLVAALPIGIAVGTFRYHSLKTSWRLYRVCAYAMFFAIVAIHPGMWGSTSYARYFHEHVMWPLLTIVTLGIGIQTGAVLNAPLVRRRLKRDRDVATTEIDALMVRMGWGVLPA